MQYVVKEDFFFCFLIVESNYESSVFFFVSIGGWMRVLLQFWNFLKLCFNACTIFGNWLKTKYFFLCIFIGLACSLISSVVQVLILTQWLLYYICRKALSKRCFLVYRAFTFSVLCMVASKIDKVYRWDGEGMFTM